VAADGSPPSPQKALSRRMKRLFFWSNLIKPLKDKLSFEEKLT
jgi:hypothetical protein